MATENYSIHEDHVVTQREDTNRLKLLLMSAIQCGYIEALQHVRKKIPKFDFNFTQKVDDIKKFTPLLYACKCNQTDIVKWLLEQPKVNKHNRTELKETPLIVAVSNEEVDMAMVRELLNNGDQNLGDKKKHKLTALHIACINGNIELVELLLQYNTAWAAKGQTAPKIIGKKELKDKSRNTPFMMALREKTKNYKEIVNMWLEKEKEPSMILRPICGDVNEKGFNAVMIAAHTGQLECLKKMEECNAVTDDLLKMKTKNGWNIIHLAAASGSLETLEWLLSLNAGMLKTTDFLDAPNKIGYTPFLCACEYKHYEIVEFFIKLDFDNFDINAATFHGMTGLHLATQHDAEKLVDLLLKKGIDPLTQESKGNTALHIATRKKSVQVENRLKKEKDFEQLAAIKNNDNKTAEDVRKSVYIPLEIKKRGQKSIDAYLNALSRGKTKNTHCNLIILGEGRVGKTSLIKSILSMQFDPDCKPTQGVILEEIELAERIDITVAQDSEIWKPVKSSSRVEEQFADSVAQHVADATPVVSKESVTKYFDDVPKEELLADVMKIVNLIRPKQRPPQSHHDRSTRREKPGHAKFSTEEEDLLEMIESIFGSTTTMSHDRPAINLPIIPLPSSKVTVIPGLPAEPKEKPKQSKHADAIQKDLQTTSDKSVANVTPPHTRQSSVSYELSKKIGNRLKNPRKKQDDLTFHTIDFAGQRLYRPMHHCFITNRAVYIVVFKLTEVRKYLQSAQSGVKDPISQIRYWLNNIIAHGSDSDAKKDDEFPRIFLVGTHMNVDKELPHLSDGEVNDHLSKTFVSDINESRYATSIQCHEDNKIMFAIENSLSEKKRPESGIIPLMKNIRKLRDHIPFLSEDIPTSYMMFEKKLLEMKEERKEKPLATTRQEVEKWAEECGIDEKDEIDTAIQFFHDIRVIVDQTLISNPFEVQRSSVTPSNVLLSPQWLGEVMSVIVELDIKDKSIIPAEKITRFKHYGIIHRNVLIKYLQNHPRFGSGLTDDDTRYSNILEILESYCLIYMLSSLHCKLLGLKESEDAHLAEGNYLIPIKLPSEIEENEEKRICSTFADCYKIEFDFQSYLPEEVYVQTVCFFLKMMTKLEGDHFDNDYVVLSRSCSVFRYIQLDDLPRAHWKIEMNSVTHTLNFSIVPRPVKKEEECCLSRFIVAVARLILDGVCKDGSLGYLKYKGGPRTVCSNCKEEVLLPLVTSDMSCSASDIEKAEMDCPNCNMNTINVNNVLSEIARIERESHMVATDDGSTAAGSDSSKDTTVFAIDEKIKKIFQKNFSKIARAVSGSKDQVIILADCLWSKELISKAVKDEILTTSGISAYERASILLSDFSTSFDDHQQQQQKEMLSAFCDVLCDQDDPSLKKIADKMKMELCEII